MAKFKRTQTQEDIDTDNISGINGLMQHGIVEFNDAVGEPVPIGVMHQYMLISEDTYQNIVKYGIPRVIFHVGKQHARWATDGEQKKMLAIEIQVEHE